MSEVRQADASRAQRSQEATSTERRAEERAAAARAGVARQGIQGPRTAAERHEARRSEVVARQHRLEDTLADERKERLAPPDPGPAYQVSLANAAPAIPAPQPQDSKQASAAPPAQNASAAVRRQLDMLA